MPKTIIAANWKMNKTIPEAQAFFKDLESMDLKSDREVVIFPPFTSLAVLGRTAVKLGGQNMYFEESGAFTGEISPLMLNDLGCEYVLLGHSERRHIFKETDEEINKKLILAIKNGLKPVFCVGETLEQRQTGQTEQVIKEQITKGLENITNISQIVIAYEPVWAIGTGQTATPEQAQEVHAQIRALTNDEISILYGGSVKPDNVSELMSQSDINGALVGGASLEADSFSKIINY